MKAFSGVLSFVPYEGLEPGKIGTRKVGGREHRKF